MLDRSEFTYLCYTPEVPPEARDRAYANGQHRFASWRRAVARHLKAATDGSSASPTTRPSTSRPLST